MGLEIMNENSGADYSGMGLGRYINIGSYVSAFNALDGNTLTTAELTGLQGFYDGLNSASLWSKLVFLHVFVGSKPGYFKYNFVNTADNDAAYRGTIVGSDLTGAYTPKGLKGLASAGRYMNTHYAFSGDTSATFEGFYNSEPELAADAIIMGARQTAAPAGALVLARKYNLSSLGTATTGRLSNATTGTADAIRATALDVNKTGVLGISNIGGVAKLWDDVNIVGSVTFPPPTAGGANPHCVLAYNGGTPSLFSSATIGTSFLLRGVSEADIINFINLVKQFNADLGR